MRKTNVTFCSFPDYSGHAKRLFEYMNSGKNDNMNLVWIVSNKDNYKSLKEKGIKSYILGSDAYFKYMKKSDIVFSTHANITGEKRKGSLYVELWHGIGLKPVGFLAKKISDSDYSWYDSISRKIDYMIVPTEFWKVIFSSIFHINPTQVLPLGYPKFDYIKNSKGESNLSKLGIKKSKYKKVLFYLPTFKKGCSREDSKINGDNILNLEPYEEKKLYNYLEKNNYLLCIKYHPSEENIINTKNHKNIFYITEQLLNENDLTISEIMNVADIMITDFSSVALEYGFLKKTVIFTDYKSEEYMKNRGVFFDSLDFWTNGERVRRIEDLFNSINSFIDNPQTNPNYELYYGNVKDGGCDKIYRYFFKNGVLKSDIKRYPDDIEELNNEIETYKNEIDKLNLYYKNRISDITKELNNLNQKNLHLEDRIERMTQTKGWKLLEKYRNLAEKLRFRKRY